MTSHRGPDELRARLREGAGLVGTFVSSPDALLAESLAVAFDVLVLDLEHSAIGLRDAQLLTLAAQSAGACALVRTPAADTDRLTALLDAGIDGVVVPKVESAEQAERIVATLRYPPDGTRGFGPRRANGYGRDAGYHQGEGSRPLCLVQIESAGGVEHAAAIAAVEGVDGLLAGPADLSFELGTPLDPFSPVMRVALERIEAAARASGTPLALASNVPAARLGELVPSCALLLQGTDLRLYAAAADAAAEGARAALAGL
jgi:2-keto-3-deoxy-L-rhamnonate aldolase RhmA